jgi:IS5 family transposase
VIGSAAKGDKEAAWVRPRTRAPAHGTKAPIAAAKDSGIIRKVATPSANEADVSVAPAIIPDAPGEVYADRAYDALAVEKAIGRTRKTFAQGPSLASGQSARSAQPPAAGHPRKD